MSQADYQICRGVLLSLISPNHSKYNYLFQQPVDTSYFPTYLQVIQRPMDFSTLRTNLESGKVYRARKEFYRDVMLIFDNAINFHAEIKENAWIVKIATSMKKIAIKEKKATEKRIKGDTGGGGGDTASITSSKVPADEDSGAVKSKKRKNSTESVGGESKKKIKLSLKKSSTASVSSIEKTKKSIPPATAAIPTDVVTSTKTKTPVVSSTSPKEASTEIPKETPKTSPEDSVKSKKTKIEASFISQQGKFKQKD